MEYQGKYELFDSARIRTYPLSQRRNKVQIQDLLDPAMLPGLSFGLVLARAANSDRLSLQISLSWYPIIYYVS